MAPKSHVVIILTSCFFAVMSMLTMGLFVEYRFYIKQVRELVELKGYYESAMNVLQQKLRSKTVQLASDGCSTAQGDTPFIVVDRNPQHLKTEALEFARKHNLEKPIQRLYRNEHTRHIRTTRRIRLNNSNKQRIQRARDIVKKAFGDLAWEWPLPRRLFWMSSPFGPRKKPNGSWGYHTGIDLAATKGTPVTTVDRGVVEEAGFHLGGYGNSVLIRHGNRLKTRYAHLATVLVGVGDIVERDTKIGTVGNTGHVRKRRGRDGTHLHFEVYIGKKRVNPLYFLRDR